MGEIIDGKKAAKLFRKKYGPRPHIRFIFAWYDFWVGFYIDLPRKRVFFLPLPCIGIVVWW
jgi:hypothetical protein